MIDEIRKIIDFNKYPLIQINDIIKIIFQNEFAGGHMIEDEQKSLLMLTNEYNSILENDCDFIFDDIGNNLCRIKLNDFTNKIGLEILNKVFIQTSKENKGTIQSFEKKLDALQHLCENDQLPIDKNELKIYLADYKKQNYPQVSHSQIYRDTYKPHYRVVDKNFCHYGKVFVAIQEMINKKNKLIISIDGNSGSGKSQLSNYLNKIYDCNVFHMDDFFLTEDLKTTTRLQEVGGNVDYERFNREVITNISPDNTRTDKFSYGKYNCQTGVISQSEIIEPKSLTIVEGVYSQHCMFRDKYDLKIFLKVNNESQRKRILERSGSELLKRFELEWIPMENKYFTESDLINKCNLIINTSNF